MNSSYHGVTAACSSKVNNITFAIVTADRDFIEADFEMSRRYANVFEHF